jgi:hypothetical protein
LFAFPSGPFFFFSDPFSGWVGHDEEKAIFWKFKTGIVHVLGSCGMLPTAAQASGSRRRGDCEAVRSRNYCPVLQGSKSTKMVISIVFK